MMMKKMINKKTTLLVVMMFTVLTTGILISIFMNRLTKEADRSQELEVFREALTIVNKNYVEDIQSKELVQSAIHGMIGSLDSRSDLITPEQYHEMQKDTKGILIRKLIGTTEVKLDSSEELKLFKNTFAIVRKNYEKDQQPKHLIYSAIKAMTESLDPHSEFMTPEQYQEMQVDAKGEFGGIGIKLDMKERILTVIGLLDDTPAFRAGIKEGDKIIKINNDFTKNMNLQDAISKTRGNPSTPVHLTILRKGWKETKDFTITRETIKIKSVNSKMLEDGIGYIKISQFQKQTASEISAVLSTLMQKHMHALILDLRNNPGGLVYSAVDVVSQFIPSEKIVVFTKNKKGEKREYRSRENNPYTSVPMVIIVNEGSASASEIVAGALKDWQRATLVGTRTYGKGSVQTVVPLKDGSALKLTTAKYYTPKGISIQTTGILPDIVVSPKINKGKLTTGKTEQTDVFEKIVPMFVDEKEDVQFQSAINLLKSKPFRVSTSPVFKNTLSKPYVSNM
jgi:carboxyl-terminal processing protease